MKKISFIIAVYNEEKNILPITNDIINCVKSDLSNYLYEIVFINDGSQDNTIGEVLKLAKTNENIFYIDFSKNFGQRNGIKAGLDLCTGDCAVSLDGDGQHPVELIPQLIAEWEAGNEIVYTIRAEDKSLGLVKTATSKIFHKVISYLSGTDIEYGVSDFRLLDRKVIDTFKRFQEKDLFWRGMVKWVGFNQKSIPYFPKKRVEGTTSYNLIGLFSLALKGIVSFSIKPLHFAIYIGLAFIGLSILYLPYIIYSLIAGIAVSGWTSLILLIIFFGGVQTTLLGIIGVYIGEAFLELKKRPNYIIRETNFKL